jgi:hypothetical protein
MPDHIRLFIEANPFDSPTAIVKTFKGVTSLRLFKKFQNYNNSYGVACYGVLPTMLVLLAMSRVKPLKNIFNPNRLSAIQPLVKPVVFFRPHYKTEAMCYYLWKQWR